jgi:hypothetical protein
MRSRPARGGHSEKRPDPTTTNPQVRSLVVADQLDAITLTGAGVPATTPGAILSSDPDEIVAYFDEIPVAVFVRLPGHNPDLIEAEAMAKLAELGVTVKVARR